MQAYIALYLLSVFVASVSQVLLKKAAQRSYQNVMKEYLNPTVIIAYVLFFATTLITVYAYKVVPLSLGPMLEATSYIYVTLFGLVFFKEKLNKKKVLAILLIVSGITISSLSTL